MADHQRHRNGPLRPLVPVVDVQIGSANARAEHANQHVVDADRGRRHLFKPKIRLAFAFDQCFHGNGGIQQSIRQKIARVLLL